MNKLQRKLSRARAIGVNETVIAAYKQVYRDKHPLGRAIRFAQPSPKEESR